MTQWQIPPQAVAFDVFGTLLMMKEPRNPWRQIAEAAGICTRDRYPVDPRRVPVSLQEFSELCGAVWREAWADDLAIEISSIPLFPESEEVLRRLGRAGLRLALASNVAQPYVQKVRGLLEGFVDVECYSCDIGAVKPEGRFFQAVCERLDVEPGAVLMVGDSAASDVIGARAAGLLAVRIRRNVQLLKADEIDDLHGILGIIGLHG